MKFFRLDGVLTLFCVLGILKLTGLIDLSWWWVTAPLWGPLAAVFVLVELAVPPGPEPSQVLPRHAIPQMKKRRIPISKLWPGFKINMAGGVTMTVTAKPEKQPDGRWLIRNDFNGQTFGDPHLTFPNIDANTTETETKHAEPE